MDPLYENKTLQKQQILKYKKDEEHRNIDKVKSMEEGILKKIVDKESSNKFSHLFFETSQNHRVRLKGGFPRKMETINIPAYSSTIQIVNVLGNIWRSLKQDWSNLECLPFKMRNV